MKLCLDQTLPVRRRIWALERHEAGICRLATSVSNTRRAELEALVRELSAAPSSASAAGVLEARWDGDDVALLALFDGEWREARLPAAEFGRWFVVSASAAAATRGEDAPIRGWRAVCEVLGLSRSHVHRARKRVGDRSPGHFRTADEVWRWWSKVSDSSSPIRRSAEHEGAPASPVRPANVAGSLTLAQLRNREPQASKRAR